MIKRSVHQEDTTITNTYTPNNRTSKYMKQKFTELKKTDNSNRVEHSNSLLSIMDRQLGITKETNLNTIN